MREANLKITQRFSGRERFCLPPKQSAQYLRMFPDAETRDGLVVCRIPAEWEVSGKVEDIEISGEIMEHPKGYSWFILVSKKWYYVKGISGLASSVEEAKQQIIEAINRNV